MSRAEINCENCGLCCMHMRTPPVGPAIPEEWAKLPENLQRELTRWMDSPRRLLSDARGQGDEFPCVWLNLCSGQCRRYQDRPQTCRNFAPGSEACLRFRAEAEAERRKQERQAIDRRLAAQEVKGKGA